MDKVRSSRNDVKVYGVLYRDSQRLEKLSLAQMAQFCGPWERSRIDSAIAQHGEYSDDTYSIRLIDPN